MEIRSRRAFMRSAVCGAAGLAAPRLALAQPAPAPAGGEAGPVEIRPLGSDTVLITGTGTNVVAAADSDGVTLVDGGRAAASGGLLDAVARAFGDRPVRTLFNTHWHPEQTGANLELARAGARIVSQVNTRLWLGTDVRRPWEPHVHEPLPPEAQPQLTFFDSGREIDLAGARVECGHLLQAHTDGDCYVYFPEADVLAIGGVIAGDRWPLIDWWTGGWFGGLVEGLETLLQIAGEDTRIVPAEGPVLTRAELAEQRDMYAELFLRFRDELLFKGLSPAEAVAAQPTRDLHPEWPNRDRFVTLAFQSLWGFYAPDV